MYWMIALAAAFLALPVLVGLLSLRHALQAIGRQAPDTSVVDGKAVEDSRRVYYFHSENCGHCLAMTPLVDRLRATHHNLIKVDVNDDIELARGFGVAATPSFVVVENGLIRQVRLGAQREKQLLSLLRNHNQ